MTPEAGAVKGTGISAFLAQCELHLALAAVEWQEEKLRLRQMLVMLLLSVGMLICSLFAISTLILVLAWETEFRLASICFLAAAYSAVTGFAWYRFIVLGAKGADTFADSRREIEADIRVLRARLKI